MLALDQFAIQSLFSDESNLFVPDISKTVWDDLDYFGWIHPDGKKGFIALESPNDGRLKGVKLKRQKNRRVKSRSDMLISASDMPIICQTSIKNPRIKFQNSKP